MSKVVGISGIFLDNVGFQRGFWAPKPVTVGHGAVWDLRDPAHDPAEFLVLIEQAHWPALRLPIRETLPPVFGGVDPPAPEFEGEVLFEPPPAV